MIPVINHFYHAGTVNSAIISEKLLHNPQNVTNSKPDCSRKVKLSNEENSSRPLAPEAVIKISLSGSVIHEPNSLLADLSGVGYSQEMKREKPGITLTYNHLQPSEKIQLITEEPVTYTFEIIV